MFETTTLNVRGLATSRDISRWTGEGACAARSSTAVAPSGSRAAFASDVASDSATRESSPESLLGDTAPEWMPVLDDEDVPDGLLRRLILPFRLYDNGP